MDRRLASAKERGKTLWRVGGRHNSIHKRRKEAEGFMMEAGRREKEVKGRGKRERRGGRRGRGG